MTLIKVLGSKSEQILVFKFFIQNFKQKCKIYIIQYLIYILDNFSIKMIYNDFNIQISELYWELFFWH